MRLTSSERELIKKAFVETFQDGKIYLFGSRVDDTKKKGGGFGDVDIGFVDQNIKHGKNEGRKAHKDDLVNYKPHKESA
ncbi:MAG: hypothetical protein IE881_08640 [Epsilonproteobacteria bacterium]|nr:hypothetical protein [Campylobacterota bacterium]